MFEHCVNLVFFNVLYSYLIYTTYLIISSLAIFFLDNQRTKNHIFCAASPPPEASRALQGAGHVGGAQHPRQIHDPLGRFFSGGMMRKWGHDDLKKYIPSGYD